MGEGEPGVWGPRSRGRGRPQMLPRGPSHVRTSKGDPSPEKHRWEPVVRDAHGRAEEVGPGADPVQ